MCVFHTELQKMVVGMQFVALVQHIDLNVVNSSGKIVCLRLIDTLRVEMFILVLIRS